LATSKSAVSRRFVAMTETALAELLAAPLGNLDLVALMIDGVHFGEHLCVVALGIGIDGTKHPPRTGRRQHREHHRRDRTAHRPKRRPICSGLCLTSSCCWTWSRNRSCRADSRLGPAGPLVRAAWATDARYPLLRRTTPRDSSRLIVAGERPSARAICRNPLAGRVTAADLLTFDERESRDSTRRGYEHIRHRTASLAEPPPGHGL